MAATTRSAATSSPWCASIVRTVGLRTSNGSCITPMWVPTSVARLSACTSRRLSREASPVVSAEESTTKGRYAARSAGSGSRQPSARAGAGAWGSTCSPRFSDVGAGSSKSGRSGTGTSRYVAEVPLDETHGVGRVEVTADDEHRVAGRVVAVEEVLGVVDRRALQVLEAAVAVVRVGEGLEEHRRQGQPGEAAVRLVEDVDPDLLLHHRDLVGEVLLGDAAASASGRPRGRAPAPGRGTGSAS